MNGIFGGPNQIEVPGDRRGVLYRYGVFKKLLLPGKHTLWGSGHRVTTHPITEPFVPDIDLGVLLAERRLSDQLEVIDVADDEIALHYEEKHFRHFLRPGRHAFWKAGRAHRFERVNIREARVPDQVDRTALISAQAAAVVDEYEIQTFEEGLLSVDGVFREKVGPGRYFFWKGRSRILLQKVDRRQQQLEISGQEIMSLDHVSLRVNFICQYRIVDAETALLKINNLPLQVHILLQLVLREYIGTLRLDEILQRKEELGPFVLGKLAERSAEFGVEFIFAGLRDIILPGEIREIMNTVIAAEKKAQANIITRREETASTRSLLNTTKLMEDNPILYRLKELEYLERICEKVGSISVTGGSGILEHLAAMIGQANRQPKA